jgi:hypothetical protein
LVEKIFLTLLFYLCQLNLESAKGAFDLLSVTGEREREMREIYVWSGSVLCVVVCGGKSVHVRVFLVSFFLLADRSIVEIMLSRLLGLCFIAAFSF